MNLRQYIAILIALLLAVAGCTVPEEPGAGEVPEGLTTFGSEEEFKAYLEEHGTGYGGYAGGIQTDVRRMDRRMESQALQKSAGETPAPAAGPEPTRVSRTNVQERGIDEPDIVKTDGERIYYSLSKRVRRAGSTEPSGSTQGPPESESLERKMVEVPPLYHYEEAVRVIDAYPPEELGELASISDGGTLLLSGDTLVTLKGELAGYDVSDPASPERIWTLDLKDSSLVDARLYGGNMLVATRSGIDRDDPCPVRPMVVEGRGGGELTRIGAGCGDIFRPVEEIPLSATYTVATLDPSSGEVLDNVTLAGPAGSTTLYMSRGSVYLALPVDVRHTGVLSEFIIENADLFPRKVVERARQLKEVNLSMQAERADLGRLFEAEMGSMSKTERERLINEMAQRGKEFAEKHWREYAPQTRVVRISHDDDGAELVMEASGRVPGVLLNQWAMDEHEGHLRVATTVRPSGTLRSLSGGRGQSENDVYILDGELEVTGAVKGMGLTEEIYAVRFMGDEGYVVTFRRTDPFYVLDLSDPAEPELKGELKVPGFSSYLHPIGSDRILGIGRESGGLKVALYSISDPAKPTELDKYILEDYGSEVLHNHRAFLMDRKHGIFFLPSSGGGYIFSYDDGGIRLKKAITELDARRALYLDNYLYLVGKEKIVVYDELSWRTVAELQL